MTATERAIELIRIAATAASDKLAADIIAYDVSDQYVITDAFLLCSASNDRPCSLALALSFSTITVSTSRTSTCAIVASQQMIAEC